MMFLSPLMLLFAATAAVPLVLHLYRQRQRTVMPFSTSRFFTRAILRAQRRLRLRRIVLLILRMAACIAIALAAARPILRSMGGLSSAGDRDVVVILDDSLSMQAADRPRPSRFEQAKRQTVQLLRELGGGDRAAVITFTGRMLGDGLSDDPARLAGELESLTPTFAAGDADAAIGRAVDLLGDWRHRRRLVVVVSDLQAGDFSGLTWPQPHEPLDIVLLRVGQPPRQNVALDSIRLLPRDLVVGQPASLMVHLTSHAAATKELTLRVVVDDVELSRQKIKLAAGGQDELTIPLEFSSSGQHRIVAGIDAGDCLAADDSLYVTVAVQPRMPVLLVDGQGPQVPRRNSAAFYLRAAMLACGESQTSEPAIRVDVISPDQLASQQLDGYRVVVLSAVRSLSLEDWRRIEDFIRRGGGVAVFLGDDAEPAFYNDALKPMTIAAAEEAELRVHHIQQDHALFQRFSGATRGAILGLGVNRYHRIEPADALVLAAMDDGQPLAVQRDLDQGRMIVWATVPVPAATNLPLRRAFIPLTSQMISYLAGGSRGEMPAVVGQPLELPVGRSAPSIGLQVRRPDGSVVEAQAIMRAAMTAARLSSQQAALPGFYQLVRSDASADAPVRALNVPVSESSPATLEQADIDRCAGLWQAKLTDDAASILSMPPTWSNWWDTLLWLTLAVVLIESLLAGRQSSAGVLDMRTKLGLLVLRSVAVAAVIVAVMHVRWETSSTERVKPAVAVMLDDSRSMAKWYDAAVRVAKNLPMVLGGREIVLFDVEGRQIETAKPQATGSRSPLAESLGRICRAMRDRPLAGIVVLSDGIDTDRSGADVKPLGKPVYPIEIVPTTQASGDWPDLSIDAISVNDRALVGNTVRVAADLSVRGKIGSQPVALSILNGQRTLASKIITWPAGAALQRVQIDFAPLQSGCLTFALQVGAVEGEKNLDDNRRFFTIDVRARPITVLYIDGVLRWEGKFLREALSNDPDLNVITSIRTLPGAGGGSRGLLLPEQLAKIDVVILGDVDGGFFSAAELAALRAWVAERGGGLLLTGGYHSFGIDGLGRTDLRDVLPVEFSAAANPQADQPFNLRLTEVGRQHPIFSFSGDSVRDTRFVQSLPRLDGCSRVAGVKPGAEILAVNPAVTTADGAALPVMIAQQFGSGRTMVFAVDTTWRWRMVVGGFTGDTSFYQRFWGQVVRWLARGEKSKDAAVLELSASRANCEPHKSVGIRAQINQPASVWKVAAMSLDSSGTAAEVAMSPAPDGSFSGTVVPAKSGRFDVIVTAQPVKIASSAEDDSTPPAQQQVCTIQVDRPDVEMEMLNTTPDLAWLRKMALDSGGQYVPADQIQAWADSLPREPVEIRRVRKIELWRHPTLVAVFLSVLCAEWIIRRKSLLL